MNDKNPAAVPERLKLSVGYQLPDRYSLTEVAETYRDAIGEVYFPWFGVPDGRGMSIRFDADQKAMEQELQQLASMGIRPNLLLNANCYGDHAVSGEFAEHIRKTVSYLRGEIGLACVTTTSLFVARLCKREFANLEVRASVNMEIGTPEAVRYLADYFDSFYAARCLNRNLSALRNLARCGKPFYLLANSGCLKNCSAHVFHDNLVAHEGTSAGTDACWKFRGVCWEFYGKRENRRRLLADSTWIRPEEVDSYSGIAAGIKLATRTNPNFDTIIKAYAERSFDGNILNLCEPDFAVFAKLSNKKFPSGWYAAAEDPDTPEYQQLLQTVEEK